MRCNDSRILVLKVPGFGAPTAVMTLEELRQHCADGVATVEMEASALFAVGAYRGVDVSSIFAISDILSEEDWNQGYHSEEKLESLKQIFEVALEAIAINSKNNQIKT